jgi:hypothetical protein
MGKYDSLDVKSESRDLSPLEQARMEEIYDEIWVKEEINAKQRSMDKDIQERYRNTSYFHFVANQTRTKMLVHTLDDRDGPMMATTSCVSIC